MSNILSETALINANIFNHIKTNSAIVYIGQKGNKTANSPFWIQGNIHLSVNRAFNFIDDLGKQCLQIKNRIQRCWARLFLPQNLVVQI